MATQFATQGGVARRGDFIHTCSGKRFYIQDPRAADVDIEDIARGLSNLCRFTGQVKDMYCPTFEQRVLTADLRWVPAGDLKVGDGLIGFDEHPYELGQAGVKRRRFRHTHVLAFQPVKRRIIRLEMEDGSCVRSSAEHPWLVATKTSRNQRWVTAERIASDIGGRNARYRRRGTGPSSGRYMHKFSEPWVHETGWEGGWLAGLFDGEGYVSIHNRGGILLGISQNPGLVLDALAATLARFGFASRSTSSRFSKVRVLQIAGGWREMMRLLGMIRPIRLLDKFVSALRAGEFTKQLNGVETPLRIVNAYHEGEDWVAGLETSTRTFLCEGYGAHNSVAEHSVRVSQLVQPKHALWALLHDAAEAYIGDLNRPTKQAPGLEGYRLIEADIERAVCERFGIRRTPSMIEDVAQADLMMLSVEASELFGIVDFAAAGWTHWTEPDPNIRIVGWPSKLARARFLQRYSELAIG